MVRFFLQVTAPGEGSESVYRDLKARDVLELPAADDAERRLKRCGEVVEDYADRVYRTLHGAPTDTAVGGFVIGSA